MYNISQILEALFCSFQIECLLTHLIACLESRLGLDYKIHSGIPSKIYPKYFIQHLYFCQKIL